MIPKVSIIVPIFNAEQYLKECLDSIINQTLKEIEIILINDGSVDRSESICKEYLTDSRVTYFYKENEGLASARRDGMEHASGEYIGFIDSDDWIDLDMYEKMYETAVMNNADVVCCNRTDANTGRIVTPDLPTGFYDRNRILKEVLPKTLAYIGKNGEKRVISWSNCRRIFRKAMLEEYNIAFDRRFRRSQDLQLTYEAMIHARGFFFMGENTFYHSRPVANSLSRGYTKNMWSLYIPLIERLYQDTESFHELDLMDQMHLRNFFFVTDCIENEMKPLCPHDRATSIRLVQEIMDHPLCQRYYGHIPVERLNPLLQGYYRLIHEKKAAEVFRFTRRYYRRQQWDKRYWRPLIHAITEGKVTGKLYKKIRGKA